MKLKEIRLGHIVLDNNVLMAPLAGYTNYCFREMCYELGAGLCFTEMVNVNSLRYEDKATKKLLFTQDGEKHKAVQLVGSDPKAFEIMIQSDYLHKYEIIDINMGCPVPNVVKSGQGSGLLDDLKRASDIIKSCKKSDKIITVKTRVGLKEDKMIAAEFVKMCEDAGASMVTIHGRTRNMMYKGTPKFREIEQAVSAVKIPVIANGGIFSKKEADDMMKETGAAGIMIARHALENPFIFSELTNIKTNHTYLSLLNKQLKLARCHYDEVYTLDYIKRLIAFFMRSKPKNQQYKQALYQCGNLIEIEKMMHQIF